MPAAALPPGPPGPPTAGVEVLRSWAERVTDMLLEYANQVVKFLSLANSGGAVALLSFVGTSELIRSLPSSWKALTFFVIGFALAGLVSILNFLSAMYVALRLGMRARQHYEGRLRLQEVIAMPRWFTWSILLPIISAVGSLACFSYAAWIAVDGYRSLSL